MASADAATAAGPADEAAPPTAITGRGLLIVVCSALGTAAYSFTWNSVGVALPHMRGAFSATTDQITWVMIAFVIGSAMTTASVGWFAARFGRKRVYLVAVLGYTLTLLGCALATSLEEAVAWRFLQGLFGAVLIPVGQTIAISAFPPERYTQASALWAMGFVTSNVVAPAIAGYLIDNYGWPWIFYVTIPVGLTIFAASWFLVPEQRRESKRLDWIGFTTLILGVGILQLMLARGERLDWFESTEIVVEALLAGLLLYVCLVHTLTARRPFLERALFADRDLVLGIVFIFLIGAALFLPLLLLPLLLQQIGGYPAIETGYLLLPRGIGSVLGLLLIARLRDRIDPRGILCFGLFVTALSTWLMSRWTVDVRPGDVVLASFLHGSAAGAVWAPLNTLTLSRLSARLRDQGFALFYLCFDMGNAIGTALIVGMHTRHGQINRAVLGEQITPFHEQARSRQLDEVWSLTEVPGLAALAEEVTRQANMIAYNNAFLVLAIIMAGLIPFVPLFRKLPRR